MDLGEEQDNTPIRNDDNKAVIDFNKGDGVAKGVKHMQLRLWYLRENYDMAAYIVNHIPGETNQADKLTKICGYVEHVKFVEEVMGLRLLGATSILNEEFYRLAEVCDKLMI